METAPVTPLHLSVSIVLFNSPLPMLQRALQSLWVSAELARSAGYLDSVTVYLVDNASGEGYREQLAEALRCWSPPDWLAWRYRPLANNRGFGHGHNSMLPELVSDLHLVLNPDVELEPDTLRAGLAAALRDNDISLLSPMVFAGSGEREFLCKRHPSVLVLLLRGFAPRVLRRCFQDRLDRYEMRDLCRGDRAVDVTIASGCFMLMRTRALLDADGFDETYFLYFEDFDLSLRLGKSGRLVFEPGMRIIHHGGYAASKGRLHLQYFIRSGIRFFNQHGWRWI